MASSSQPSDEEYLVAFRAFRDATALLVKTPRTVEHPDTQASMQAVLKTCGQYLLVLADRYGMDVAAGGEQAVAASAAMFGLMPHVAGIRSTIYALMAAMRNGIAEGN